MRFALMWDNIEAVVTAFWTVSAVAAPISVFKISPSYELMIFSSLDLP